MKEFLEKLHNQLEDAILSNTPRPQIRAAQKEIEAKLAEITAPTHFVVDKDDYTLRVFTPLNQTPDPLSR